MIRKSLIALAALTALGTAALAPTSASAWGHHHRHWGFGFGIVDVAPVSDCYLVQKMTRSGYVKTVQVCD